MTINIIDAAGATQTVNTLPALGVAAAAFSLPVVISSDVATGTITTQNLTPTIAATAGSAVEIVTIGYTSLSIQTTGTYTGALSLQGTVDGTNWITMAGPGALINVNTGAGSTTIGTGSQGIFQADIGGFTKARVTGLAAITGTATVILRVSSGTSAVAIDAPLPTGTNSIGSVIVTSTALANPSLVVDQASAALTTTTTGTAITPGVGQSYEVNMTVSLVSGTNPTLDFVIQESDDNGTTWFDVYHFERITAAGQFRSPKIPLTGTRVRYVQTVGGTTPSFTRAINRVQSSESSTPLRRFLDRTLAASQALNATTASYQINAATRSLQFIVSAGAITTTAPVIKLQGSEDGGLTWYDIPGASLTAVASSAVQVTVSNITVQSVRAIVATAGSGATLNYICIKAF